MKQFVPFITIVVLSWMSCKKDTIITSPDALLKTSVDMVQFDTVFTSLGSVTQSFTVVNENDQKLNISSIQLKGTNSPFAINVNGTAGTRFSNLQLNPNDSLYVFVKVTIDPNASQLPFLVRDSIEITFNGNMQKVQLQAYGQNARFINGGRISVNTTWNKTLPYVITKPLTVDAGITLTIQEGTKVYLNATAPLLVNGTLKTLGNFYDSTRIIFRGDRLDGEYKDFPGTWPGIIFNNSSSNNELKYTNILNAYQALVVQGGPNQVPAKLKLSNCIVDNAYDVGLFAFNTSVTAENCLFSQIGNEGNAGSGGSNVIVSGGGSYAFNHCTVATFANYYQNHKQPVLYITNNANGVGAALNFSMDNSIIYGLGGITEDELVTSKVGNAVFNVAMRNVLYKVKNDPAGVTFTNSIKNQDPQFDSINTSLRKYNFRLRDSSPCVNAGLAGGPATDLDGKPRPVGTKPDLGCYEKQ